MGRRLSRTQGGAERVGRVSGGVVGEAWQSPGRVHGVQVAGVSTEGMRKDAQVGKTR